MATVPRRPPPQRQINHFARTQRSASPSNTFHTQGHAQDHRTSILYFGTPVVLLSTLNDDGSPNLAPWSSAWWLGWNCMLGLGAKGHSPYNLKQRRECVLNLPSIHQVAAVNRLARLTGSLPVPPHKLAMGYRHERDKFGVAGLTSAPSDLVQPPRVAECPVQLEAVVESIHDFGHRPDKAPGALAIEVRIVLAHIDESLVVPGKPNHIDPDRCRPLLMSFANFYGLACTPPP